MKAQRLLPTLHDLQRALGSEVALEEGAREDPAPGVGSVVRAAAVDSAYRRFTGRLRRSGGDSPITVSALALVFDGPAKADRTFGEVARAAHLRAEVDGSHVAVETVTAPSGLVSYWGFVHRDVAMVILTLDTVDPQRLSVADLRSVVARTAERLDHARR